jgi:hypothetical protein
MRLIVLWLGHGKTQKDGLGIGGSSSTGGGECERCSRIAHGASCSFACLGANDLEGYGQGTWGWTCDGGSVASPVPATQVGSQTAGAAVGRATAGAHGTGRRAGFFGGMEGQSRAGPVSGSDAGAGRLGTRAGTPGKAVGGVSLAGATPLAQSGSGHTPSQGRAVDSGRVEKKRCPKSWRPC